MKPVLHIMIEILRETHRQGYGVVLPESDIWIGFGSQMSFHTNERYYQIDWSIVSIDSMSCDVRSICIESYSKTLEVLIISLNGL